MSLFVVCLLHIAHNSNQAIYFRRQEQQMWEQALVIVEYGLIGFLRECLKQVVLVRWRQKSFKIRDKRFQKSVKKYRIHN